MPVQTQVLLHPSTPWFCADCSPLLTFFCSVKQTQDAPDLLTAPRGWAPACDGFASDENNFMYLISNQIQGFVPIIIAINSCSVLKTFIKLFAVPVICAYWVLLSSLSFLCSLPGQEHSSPVQISAGLKTSAWAFPRREQWSLSSMSSSLPFFGGRNPICSIITVSRGAFPHLLLCQQHVASLAWWLIRA